MGTFDRAFAFVSVATSTLGKLAGGVLLNLRAFAAGDDDADAEGSDEEDVYGVPGVFFRPRDADATGTPEYLAARGADGLTPFAGRDLRITKARGPIAKGSVGFGGYGKAFVAIEDAADGGGSTVTIYVPFAFDGAGVPSKAHVITLDSATGNEAIVVAHAAGHALVLSPDGTAILKNKGGDGFIGVNDAGIVMSGDLKLGNNAMVGNPTLAANVALAGPLIDWIKAASAVLSPVITAINALAPFTISPTVKTAFDNAVLAYSATGAPTVQTSKLKAEAG